MAAALSARIAIAAAVLVASCGFASAQNYDGNGIVKFGVFGQGTSLSYKETLPTNGSTSPSGFAGGVSAGYDFILGQRFLIGAEADLSLADIRGDMPQSVFSPSISYGLDYLVTTRGRLGYFIHPNWMIYGTAGAAWLGFEAQSAVTGTKHSNTLTGWTVGGGTEVEWRSIIFFAEYLHAEFGTANFGLDINEHRVDANSDVFRLGVKFKVGYDYDHDLGRYYEPIK